MKRLKTVLTFALALALACPSLSAAEPVDGIAIIVNNSVVTLSEYVKKEKEIRRQFPEAQREDVVNAIIQELVLTQTAEKRKLDVSKEELTSAVEVFKKSQGLDDEGLIQLLVKKQTSLKDFFKEIKLQILTSKLVGSEVERLGFSVDDGRIEEFYLKRYPDASTEPQVRIAHILLSNREEDAFEKAHAIAKAAKSKSADFGALARRYSTDAQTAVKGGDLGYFTHDELIKPLRKAVKGAQAGDVSGPVESRAGFHIVKVIAVKEKGTLVPPEMKEALVDEIAAIESERIITSIIEEGFEKSYIDVRLRGVN